MKFQKSLIAFLLFFTVIGFAQSTTQYHPEKEKTHNLVHTKLKVDFDFSNKTMNGEAWVTAKPHFYSTNSIVLDAKAMLIHEISMNNSALEYSYDDKLHLVIQLPKIYQKNEEFTVYIKYTAQPEKVYQKASKSIEAAKGLYFINADGSDKKKPTQIWTKGETEASSCWFPTIDAPNQKTTQEIYITVPNKFVTLSNGALINQTKNGNNRTDYWKMDQKHAPYLVFMGIGEYEIIKDSYKNISVNYYVEKEFALNAKDIFGNTPEMMAFFSDKLGVAYPWSKYSQIVGRDYVSGAMENTTAVIHAENAYQKPGQLIDENVWENTIAHELFHHWFGNLVTTESWSHLTLNESFANYGEYLWREHKYGKVNSEMHLFEQVKAYIEGESEYKNLVRFDYKEKEDMFDLVSYNKGGAILHMLRTYLGDEAFFLGLKTYLTENKFQSAEVHQLRLILEKITGKDLNWFFNQWYFGSGHPNIEITYDYNTLRKTVSVNVIQLQEKTFQFPFAIDVFEGSKRTRHTVFVDSKDASFTFPYTKQPNLVQVNADGSLVCEINENKILSDYIFQLKNADNYKHRREALIEVATRQDDKDAYNAVEDALNDKAYKIKILALEKIDLINKSSKKSAIKKIMQLANSDKKTLVKAAAINTLGKLTDPELTPIFIKALQSKSYSVLGKGLVSLYYVNKQAAIAKSKQFPDEVRQILATPLTRIFIEEKDEGELPFIAKNVLSGMFLTGDDTAKEIYKKAFDQISKSDNTEALKNLLEDMIDKGKQYKKFNFDKVVINLMRNIVKDQEKANTAKRDLHVELIKNSMTKLL